MDFRYVPGKEYDEVRVFMRSKNQETKFTSTPKLSPAMAHQSSRMLTSTPSTHEVRATPTTSCTIKSTPPSNVAAVNTLATSQTITRSIVAPPLPSPIVALLAKIPQSSATPSTSATCNQTPAITNQPRIATATTPTTSSLSDRIPTVNQPHPLPQRPFCSPKQCMLTKKNALPTQLRSVKTVTPFKPVVGEQPTGIVQPNKRQSSDDETSSSSESDQ